MAYLLERSDRAPKHPNVRVVRGVEVGIAEI
jgi:hypothetical protein